MFGWFNEKIDDYRIKRTRKKLAAQGKSSSGTTTPGQRDRLFREAKEKQR